jgi:hypothetical protein
MTSMAWAAWTGVGPVEHLHEVEPVARYLELGGEAGRALGVTPGDTHHVDVVQAAQRGHVLAGDGALAGHHDADALSHAPPLRWRVVHNTVDDLVEKLARPW